MQANFMYAVYLNVNVKDGELIIWSIQRLVRAFTEAADGNTVSNNYDIASTCMAFICPSHEMATGI